MNINFEWNKVSWTQVDWFEMVKSFQSTNRLHKVPKVLYASDKQSLIRTFGQ